MLYCYLSYHLIRVYINNTFSLLLSRKYKNAASKNCTRKRQANCCREYCLHKICQVLEKEVFSARDTQGRRGETTTHALLQGWSSADWWSLNRKGKLLKLTYVLQGASPCKSSNDRNVPQHHCQACKGDWFMSTHLLAPALRSPVISRKEPCVPRLHHVKHRENILLGEANTITRVVRRDVRGRMCEYCSPCRGARGGQLCS